MPYVSHNTYFYGRKPLRGLGARPCALQQLGGLDHVPAGAPGPGVRAEGLWEVFAAMQAAVLLQGAPGAPGVAAFILAQSSQVTLQARLRLDTAKTRQSLLQPRPARITAPHPKHSGWRF